MRTGDHLTRSRTVAITMKAMGDPIQALITGEPGNTPCLHHVDGALERTQK